MHSHALALVVARRSAELRHQHRQFLRVPYDGHSRRSGLTSMHRLGLRRARRRWRQNFGCVLTRIIEQRWSHVA